MSETDLADLYGVPTKALNQAVRRNIEHFPSDFIFQLNADKKQEVVINCDHLAKLKLSSSLSNGFIKHGALMFGDVLKSLRAVEIGILVLRTFVQIRELLSTDKEHASKFKALARSSHDQAIAGLIEAIQQLLQVPVDSLHLPIVFTCDISELRSK